MPKEYFECDCSQPFHELVVEADMDSGCDFFCIYARLKHYRGFFSRLWIGTQYILGFSTCKLGDFDSFLLKEDDIDRFMIILNKYKTYLKGKQEGISNES